MRMKIIVKVDGMSCGGCRSSVENALKRVPGVRSVDVSLEKKEAVVEFDETKASASDLRSAVEQAGYTAR